MPGLDRENLCRDRLSVQSPMFQKVRKTLPCQDNPIAIRVPKHAFSRDLARGTMIVGRILVLCFASVPSTFAVTLPFTDDFSDGSATDDTPVSWTPVGAIQALSIKSPMAPIR